MQRRIIIPRFSTQQSVLVQAGERWTTVVYELITRLQRKCCKRNAKHWIHPRRRRSFILGTLFRLFHPLIVGSRLMIAWSVLISILRNSSWRLIVNFAQWIDNKLPSWLVLVNFSIKVNLLRSIALKRWHQRFIAIKTLSSNSVPPAFRSREKKNEFLHLRLPTSSVKAWRWWEGIKRGNFSHEKVFMTQLLTFSSFRRLLRQCF